MNKVVECEICGGTEFYKAAGFYYCNECQTRTQEIQEYVFQQEISQVNVKKTRAIKKPDSAKTSKLSSYECYNIIIYSLTKELVGLGANEKLVDVVKCLWMKYLEKLEVFKKYSECLPKLQVARCKRDAKIIYGSKKKRKRRRSPSTQSHATAASNTTRRQRTKKQRALAVSHYEEYTKKSMQPTSSLHNQNLMSLKSAEKSTELNKISYNRYASKEFRSRMCDSHLYKHRSNVTSDLKCHRLSTTNCSYKYQKGAESLSPIKLYSILYIGLLIVKDKIQLGDLFRFIREGHLSFNNYAHFFPEEYNSEHLDIPYNNNLFSNENFRVTAARLAKFIDVVSYIQVPDLISLSERYGEELNLPDEMKHHVKNIISRVQPTLRFTKRSTKLPNYEGRVASIIIFVLKLLFGLDGETEFAFSKFCNTVDSLPLKQSEMFDIVKWLKYLEYRSCLMEKYHFPTNFSVNPEEFDADLYIEYIISKNIDFDKREKLTKELESFKDLLESISDMQGPVVPSHDFLPSLTPFRDYLNLILNSKIMEDGMILDIAKLSFRDTSLKFLLEPNAYLKWVNNKKHVEIVHGGKNQHWKVEKIESLGSETGKKGRDHTNMVTVKLISGESEEFFEHSIHEKESNLQDRSHMHNYYLAHKNEILRNRDRIKATSKLVPDKSMKKHRVPEDECYSEHYHNFEAYWMLLQLCFDKQPIQKRKEFLKKYPFTFRIILNECARMIEQPNYDLFDEFQLTEVYMAYKANYQVPGVKPDKVTSDVLARFVKKSTKHW